MSNKKDDNALKYANEITSKFLSDNIYLTKDQLSSYIYWAFCNGMKQQQKNDVDKILFN